MTHSQDVIIDDIVTVAYLTIIKLLSDIASTDKALTIECDIDTSLYPILIRYGQHDTEFCVVHYHDELFWWPRFDRIGFVYDHRIDLTDPNCFIKTVAIMLEVAGRQRSS